MPSKCLINSVIPSTQTYWTFGARSYTPGPVLGPGDASVTEAVPAVTAQVVMRTRKGNKAGKVGQQEGGAVLMADDGFLWAERGRAVCLLRGKVSWAEAAAAAKVLGWDLA